MADDLAQPERNSVRTPMQWSDEPNGGFSNAREDRLIRPVISSGAYGFQRVNTVSQHRDDESLLNWVERLIGLRKECPEFGWGDCNILEVGDPHVFAHRCRWQDNEVVALHNLSAEKCSVSLDLDVDEGSRLVDWFGNRDYQSDGGPGVELDAYGYRWFRLGAVRP
ncbi:MAG: DUF3459 domain-containing protein [Dehalococcoidia bacterium]|nr:DUF3459 domain-containing protein [Dehalococcoidia bacterium]